MANYLQHGTRTFLYSRHLGCRAGHMYGNAVTAFEDANYWRVHTDDKKLVSDMGRCARNLVRLAASPYASRPLPTNGLIVLLECHLATAQVAIEGLGPGLAPLDTVIKLLNAAAGLTTKIAGYVRSSLVWLVERVRSRRFKTEGSLPPAAPLCYTRVAEFLRQALLGFSYADLALYLQPAVGIHDLEPFRELSAAFFSLYETSVRALGVVNHELPTGDEPAKGYGIPAQVNTYVFDPPDGLLLCVCSQPARVFQKRRRDAEDKQIRAQRNRCRLLDSSTPPAYGRYGLELHGPSPLKEPWTPETGL